MTDNTVFILEEPIKSQLNVDGKNDIVDINSLYLSAPTYKEKDRTIPLKQAFITAQSRLGMLMMDSIDQSEAQRRREEREEEGEEEMDISGIKMILFASGGDAINLKLFFDNFAKLLCSVAFKDEDMKQPIRALDLQKMSEDDFENLIATYIQVFFISSWMKTLS
jgi:hypothetical protein